ncbi:transposase (plasmid) [Scytonema sp. HK-05]|nr:transposase [Scytonema sp. HK-05]BAY50356.1 transposase [Scytonema sp. HK-05]
MNPSILRNLTSEQWKLLSGLIPKPKTGGRKRNVDMQAIVNAILYILCAGCAWRMLPNDFPKWKTVYHYERQWRKDGTWQEIHSWITFVGTCKSKPRSIPQRGDYG